MKYYIADDDKNVVKILENIIEDKDMGTIVGTAYDGETAFREIKLCHPDIVLVDLLMPKMDGNALVRELKVHRPDLSLIMISQVSDHEIVSDSYNAGIDFFISKPINKIAVEKVINQVAEKIELKRMLGDIRKVFGESVQSGGPKKQVEEKNIIKEIKTIMSSLGMLGEKGTSDIIKVCEYICEKEISIERCDLEEICKAIGDNPKTVKQRIRRSIKCGLTNLAYMGIEDYYNENFQSYASILYDFENVKTEMDHVRGKRIEGGKVGIHKFIEGVLFLGERS